MSPEEIYDDMIEMFGSLPHPVHEPKRSEWYIKMYKYKRTKSPITTSQKER